MDELELVLDDDSRSCPFCGEAIKRVAIKCRYCGEMLGDQSAPGVFRQGKKVVLRKEAMLPARCFKTNGPADHWLMRELHWHHPTVFLFLLLSPVVYILAALVAQKRARVRVPLCDASFHRRRRNILIAWLVAVGSAMALIAAGVVADSSSDAMTASLAVCGILGILGAIIFGMVTARVVSPSRIDAEYVWLVGAHPDYLAELPEWLGQK